MRRLRVGYALRLAVRDLRGGSRHVWPIVAGIALGVGAIVAVGTAADTVRRAVSAEARSLMAADVEVASTRELSAAAESAVDQWVARGVERTRVTDLMAMAVTPRVTALVELKAVEVGYPFYGRIETDPAFPLADLLAAGPVFGAVVQEAFLIRSGLGVGDRFTIGAATFAVTAVLRAEPDRAAGAFSLGPRVFITRAGLTQTGLIQPGSRVRYRTLLRVSEPMVVHHVRDELKAALQNEPVQVNAFTEAQPQLRRTLERLSSYLGLIGLTALLIGGVGVAGSLRALLAERWHTVAVLKCVGAQSGTIGAVFLAEMAVLGAVGGVLGAGLGALAQTWLIRLAGALVTLDLATSVSPWPYVQGLAIGLLAILLFGIRPLLQVARHSPAAVLRREIAPPPSSRGAAALAAAAVVVGLVGLAWWQAGTLTVAAIFLAAAAAAAAALSGAARLLARAVRAAPRPRRVAWRRGLAGLYRPGAGTASMLVSIGVGVMTVSAVVLVEQSIHAELSEQIPHDAPSLFFIDVQPDQYLPFDRLMKAHRVAVDLTPVVRARILSVNGAAVGSDGPPGTKPEHRWAFTREYVVTFRDDIPPDNAVVAGSWWTDRSHDRAVRPAAEDAAPVSIEAEVAERLGIGVGSSVVFDVQGVSVAARVANLRSVDWDNRSTNFYIIFAPGVLEAAPLTYLGAARVAESDEVPLQQAVVAAFPNVTTIQVRDIVASAARVLDRMAVAVRAVAACTVAAGFVVLAGALAAARDARLREAMVFRALGATRRAVTQAFAIEFGVLGAAAGLIGAVLASALSWAMLRWVLDLPWIWAPGALAAAVGLTTVGTMIVGVLSTYHLVGKRPSAVLRGE